MATINYFATHNTDQAHEFLLSYKNGVLVTVEAMRSLDDRVRPHIILPSQLVENDYIIFTVGELVKQEHLTWLYNEIIAKRQVPSKLEFLNYLFSVMYPRVPARLRTDQQWERVKEARSQLELANMAFQHFVATSRGETDERVTIKPGVVLIEYNIRRNHQDAERLTA